MQAPGPACRYPRQTRETIALRVRRPVANEELAHAARTEDDRSVAQLRMLHSLGATLNVLTSADAIGEAITAELDTLIDYHNCRVYLLQDDGVTLSPIAFRGELVPDSPDRAEEYAEETFEELVTVVGEGIDGPRRRDPDLAAHTRRARGHVRRDDPGDRRRPPGVDARGPDARRRRPRRGARALEPGLRDVRRRRPAPAGGARGPRGGRVPDRGAPGGRARRGGGLGGAAGGLAGDDLARRPRRGLPRGPRDPPPGRSRPRSRRRTSATRRPDRSASRS